MPAGGLLIGAGAEAFNIAESLYKDNQAKKALNKLNETPISEVSVSPELQNSYGRSESMSKYGFSPEETVAFNQNLSRTQNTQFQAAKDIGGGQLSSTINNMDNASNINAINNFAAKGAGLQLEKIQYADELAGQIQNIKDRKVEDARNRRMTLESQYGGAIKQQQENISQGIGSIAALEAQYGTSVQEQNNFNKLYPDSNNTPDLSGLDIPIYR